MREFLLFLVALVITAGIFLIGLVIQTIRYLYKGYDLGDWYFALALSLDDLWATLIYGTVGHTVSAITYKKATKGDKYHKVQMKIINFLFRDDYHCKKAYEDEYNN
jgi:hypothetical protein